MDCTSIGPTLGPIAEEFICYAFLSVPDLLLLVRQYFMFWAVWGLFYVYGYVGVRSTSYPKSSYLLDIMYVVFLLNGFHLFIWNVTPPNFIKLLKCQNSVNENI